MSERPPSTCLFLPELPADLTDQVLERHFRGFVGYDSSRTKHDRNGRLVGFVEFTTVDDAVRCRDSMQGASPFPGVHWQIHFSNNTQSRPTASAKRQRSEESEPPLAQRNSFPMEPPRPMAPPAVVYGRDDPRYAPPPHHHNSPLPPTPSGYGAPYAPSAYGSYGAPPPSDPLAMQPQPANYIGMHLPHDASSTLYIEGLPTDATEREVAHVFRRYEGLGFRSIRMSSIKSSRNPGTNLFLCFAEFDNAHQATVALCGLQGYRFDTRVDGEKSGIRISYAKAKGGGGGQRGEGGGQRAPPGGPPPPAAMPQAHSSDERGYGHAPPRHELERRESRGGGDDRGGGGGDERRSGGGRDTYYDEGQSAGSRGARGYDNDRSGYRRDGREHSDRYGEEYEDSERGDDELFHRADNVSVQGIID